MKTDKNIIRFFLLALFLLNTVPAHSAEPADPPKPKTIESLPFLVDVATVARTQADAAVDEYQKLQLEQIKAVELTKLNQLKAVNDKHQGDFLTRLKQNNDDPGQFGRDIEKLIKGLPPATKVDSAAAQKELDAKLDELRRTLEPRAPYLPADARADLISAVPASKFQKAQFNTGAGATFGSDDGGKRRTKSEKSGAPGVSRLTFNAPYTTGNTSGSRSENFARADTGKMHAVSVARFIGSDGNSAWVVQRLEVPAGIRRIRVEVDMSAEYFVQVGGASGYASAEALMNCYLLDGRTPLGADRLSLNRVVSAVIGGSHQQGNQSETLSFECDNPRPDRANTFMIGSQIWTWAGCGGFYGADARNSATVSQIRVELSR